MKKTLIVLVVALFLAGTPAWADMYLVELGDPLSEVLYGINTTAPGPAEWGSYEPWTSGATGGYAGIASDFVNSNDQTCRMVWGGDNWALDSQRWAEIVFPGNIHTATIRHLDGSAQDDFDVHVYSGASPVDVPGWDAVKWGDYTAGAANAWILTTFSGTPGSTLRITATGNWSLTYKYGLLGIDRVEAVPVPGAFVLGAIGLSLAKWRLRRRETL